MLTFKNCYDQVMALFDVLNDTGTDLTVVKNALNRAHAQRVQEANYEWNLSGKLQLAVTANTQRYILPYADVDRLLYMFDSTHSVWLSVVPFNSLPEDDYGSQTAAGDNRVVVVGYSPVKTQPTAATTVTVTSTATEDGTQSLYIEGIDSDGEVVSESVLSTGTSTNSYVTITYLRVDGVWAGTLSLSTSGGTLLVRLSSGQLGKQFPIVEFVNTPTAAATVEYRYVRRARQLTEDNDIPDIPYPQSTIIVYDALLELATYNELDSESVNIWREKQRQWWDNLAMGNMPGSQVNGRTGRTFGGI